MRFVTLAGIVLALVGLSPQPALPASIDQEPAAVIQSAVVSLDVVVHDKKNKPVLNLKPEEIQITDAGSVVKITGFQLVNKQTNAAQQVTLVFDRLTSSSAADAKDVASKLLKTASGGRFSFAVLSIEGRLKLLQDFTAQSPKVAAGISLATGAVQVGKQTQIAEAELASEAKLGLDSTGTAVNIQQRAAARAMLGALRESQRIVQDERAQPALAGLQALAQIGGPAAGHRALIFFSQDLWADAGSKDRMKAIAEAANKSNTSIYVVDTNAPDDKENTTMMAAIAMATMGAAGRQNTPQTVAQQTANHTPPGMIAQGSEQMGRIEFASASTTQNPLQALAAQTGGDYLVVRSDKQIRRLIGDMTNYYQVSYTPADKVNDGQFHPVTVRSSRKGVTVRSMQGYFAVPAGTGIAAQPFESPLMRVLSQAQLPSDLQFRSQILQLGDLPNGNTNSLSIEVPLSQLEPEEDNTSNLFSVHFSFVAEILDKTGAVLEHFSEDIPRRGALASLEQARSQTVTLQRHFIAAPGEYTLQTAVLDQNSKKVGGQRVHFTIPGAPAGPSFSDIVLVREMDPASAEADPLEPLFYQNAKVIPNLSLQVPADAKQISLFFLIHPGVQDAAMPKLDMTILRDGHPIGHSLLNLPKQNGQTAIPFLESIRSVGFTPGNYELRLTVGQGEAQFARTLSWRLGNPETEVAAAPQVVPAAFAPESQLAIVSQPKDPFPAPAAAELDDLLNAARERVLEYTDTLPNFMCLEVINRSVARRGSGDWRHQDTVKELLTYRDKAEKRTVLEIDGARSHADAERLQGTRSHGEFGATLNAVFEPSARADFHWQETGKLSGGPVQVFSYQVGLKNSDFWLSDSNGAQIKTAFHGLVYLDAATKSVRRVSIEADELPRNFAMRAASIVIDYDFVAIGSHDYLLPIRGEVSTREGKRKLVLNELQFRNYRRFGSESRMIVEAQ